MMGDGRNADDADRGDEEDGVGGWGVGEGGVMNTFSYRFLWSWCITFTVCGAWPYYERIPTPRS